ncbi:MAG TPA: bifunctional phosphopantothenoylcysteine decarboxylase/phosphopantothenate--cysteine ligase CoaBC [Actinomycetota bacterium]|nr:bifunctional phosphopantothenoylcysteine decarboxylase/phosphopantothenate--cysteine ligase CoaBC [Actinomycetota bacterium]
MLLGVSGGIACYKSVELARQLGKLGARVQVVMTKSATKFVGPITFSSLTHNRVYVDMFDEDDHVLHVRLAREADIVLVAPATANILSKAAHGGSDDLLSAVLLTAKCPVVVAPAMHTEMWEHAATKANVETLRARGVHIVDPEAGELAGGDEGVGRLAEPSSILDALAEILSHGRDLAGLRFVITAGGTQEPIDPVRFITNRSSGKMGYAIAREAALRGADVTLVSGPVALEAPARVELVCVRTAMEMRDAVLARFEDADVVVQAAAVADFRPADPKGRKIKKSNAPPSVDLVPNPDIATELGANKAKQILVGFAAETDDHLAGARKKLGEKNLDLVFMNPVGLDHAGFEVDTNEGVILGADGSEVALPLQLKSQIARALCDRIALIVGERESG